MDETEKRKQSHDLHNKSKALLEKQRSGACSIVTGVILIIIGCIFLPLSYKMVRNKIQGIDTSSLAFILMCICLGIGTLLLIYGIIRILVSLKKRRQVKAEIRQLQDVKTK